MVHVFYFLIIPCQRKCSQSENRKAIVYLTVLHPTFPSCAMHMLLVLATVFSMAWYKIIIIFMQRSLSWYITEYPPCHMYFLGIFKARMYTEKIPVTCRIFRGIPLKTVVPLVCIRKFLEKYKIPTAVNVVCNTLQRRKISQTINYSLMSFTI